MCDEKKNKKEGKSKDVGFDMEGLGLGGFLSGIGKLIDLAGKLKDVSKEGEIDLSHLKKGMKGVYGFTIKTAVGGKPEVETFGNIKKTPQGPKVEEEREPLTDIFDEKDEIIVMVEMPGIAESDIKIDLKEDILEIISENKNRKYRKEMLLPSKGSIENLKSKFNNGILEIRIKK